MPMLYADNVPEQLYRAVFNSTIRAILQRDAKYEEHKQNLEEAEEYTDYTFEESTETKTDDSNDPEQASERASFSPNNRAAELIGSLIYTFHTMHLRAFIAEHAFFLFPTRKPEETPQSLEKLCGEVYEALAELRATDLRAATQNLPPGARAKMR
jgi:uncharacterized protein (UPF0305 family)